MLYKGMGAKEEARRVIEVRLKLVLRQGTNNLTIELYPTSNILEW